MNRRSLHHLAPLLGLVVLLLAPETVAAQCAMCRTALESPQGLALAAAFRRGVLVLLVAPFAAVGTVVWLMRRRMAGPGAAGS